MLKILPVYPNWPSDDIKPAISYTAEGNYMSCPRKFLYEQESGLIGSKVAKLTYIDKTVQPTGVIVGTVTDVLIEESFRNYCVTGELPHDYLGNLYAACQANFRMRAEFTLDWAKALTTGGRLKGPDRILPLEGIVREPKITKEGAKLLVERSVECITNLFDSPLYERLMRLDRQDVFTQRRGVFNGEKVSIPWYSVGDLAVYASFDLIVKEGPKWLIIDWKTGSQTSGTERVEMQLNYYTGFLTQEYGVDPDDVELIAAWIGDGKEISTFEAIPNFVSRREARWRAWRDTIREDVDAVRFDRALLDERFPMTNDIFKCQWCKYHSCPGYQRHKTMANSLPIMTEEVEMAVEVEPSAAAM